MPVANVDDLREAAERRLPRILFDYIDGGAFSERTVATNRDDFDAWQLQARVLTGLTARDLGATILGVRRRLPMALGPVGFSGLFAPHGELQAARAAHSAGIPFCLSNFGMATLEQLRDGSDGALWFQLYLIRDRALLESFIERAESTEVEALCVTVDCAVGGVRERDVRSGFRTVRRLTPALALSLLSHPRWCLDMLRAGRPRIGHLADRPEFRGGVLEQAAGLAQLVDPGVGWADLQRVRDRWKGKLVVKGILHVEDAERVVALGADAMVVSNHGGRELDGARSTIDVLPEIAAAVGGRVEVLLDSGVRRGTHVAKALALGASGVLLGRAYAYGLAAEGGAGVSKAIEMIATELDVTMSLMGICRADDLHAKRDSLLHRRAPPTGARPDAKHAGG